MPYEEKIKKYEQAIMEVIAFFDLFDFAATAVELWRYGAAAGSLADYNAAAGELRARGRLAMADGFYSLPGRSGLAADRRQKQNHAERKFRRARRAARVFKFIPWVRLIAVGNIIGPDNLKDGGDIDLFIVAEPKRIWLSRFLCAGLAEMLGWRPRPGAERDKICLSFFLSEQDLDLRGFFLPGREQPGEGRLFMQIAALCAGSPPLEKAEKKPAADADPYFLYWLAGLEPIYDADRVYGKLASANGWLRSYLPNWTPRKPGRRRTAGKGPSRFYRDLADLFSGGLEPALRKFQLKRMPEYLARPLNKDTRVMANDHIIKLHANDRREEYRTRYQEKLKAITFNK